MDSRRCCGIWTSGVLTGPPQASLGFCLFATRTAVVQLVVGGTSAAAAAGFLKQLSNALRKLGITVSGVSSDIQRPVVRRQGLRDQRSPRSGWPITRFWHAHRPTTPFASRSTAPCAWSFLPGTSTAAAPHCRSSASSGLG